MFVRPIEIISHRFAGSSHRRRENTHCLRLERDADEAEEAGTIPGTGLYSVGEDVAAGQYASPGQAGCYYAIRTAVGARSDKEVTEAFGSIMRMYDAVAAYQPRPVKHPGGARRREVQSMPWPVPALHILETRQGAFFHETP